MESSDLFSHPYEPEVVEKRESSNGADGESHLLGSAQKGFICF